MPCSKEFFDAYVKCALWSTNDESDDSGGEPLDRNYGPTDIAPESLASMRAECDAFVDANAADLAEACALSDTREWSYDEQAGHDFWLTRNGHGAGFWDRDLGAVGDRLSDACEPYGMCDLFVEEGVIYAS